jgi:FkbM family methyltransferase
MLLYLEGERSIAERYLIRGLLSPGMRVVDVGANIGYYLLMFERGIGPSGKMVSIEPSPENLPELKENIRSNRFGNVELHENAVGSSDGRIGLRSEINSGIVQEEEGCYSVEMKRLDSIIKERVDFLKIDVEGYEGEVLRGAWEVIARDRPVLFLELHPQIVRRYGDRISVILEELSRYYRVIDLFESKRVEQTNPFQRIFNRYSERGRVVQITDKQHYIHLLDHGQEARTFWAICRN